MTKHTAIAALAKGRLDAIQVETEHPGPGQVLIKVEYASMIAFDTYITDLGYAVAEYPAILGFNAAGTVAEAGKGVSTLGVGDRVMGFSVFNFQGKNKGTLQEFILLPEELCAKVPDNLSLDSAATIPDNFVTAFYTLFDHLSLPIPSAFPAPSPPSDHATPILIYGAGSTASQYALQLLRAAGYTNVVAAASPRHTEFLKSIGASAGVVDYASPTFAADIARAVGGPDGKVALALDGITADGTMARIAEVLKPTGTVALLLPIKTGDTVAVGDAGMRNEVDPAKNPFSEDTQIKYVRTFTYRSNEYMRANLMPKILPELLVAGVIQPNRVRLLDQGTLKERVETGLDLLRNNKVSGEKVIVKVA